MSLDRWALAALALRISSAIGKLQDVGTDLSASLERRALQLERGIRGEVRRIALALGMTLIAAVCALAALGFAAAAILMAAGDANRVLAASVIAIVLALLALIAALIMRAQTSAPRGAR
jgi:Putative Actinobacterial Holin-X, holin superfamily III